MERLDHGHLHPLVEHLENKWMVPGRDRKWRLDDIVSELEADALTKELNSQLKISWLIVQFFYFIVSKILLKRLMIWWCCFSFPRQHVLHPGVWSVLLQGERGGEDVRPLHVRLVPVPQLWDLRLRALRHHRENLRPGTVAFGQVSSFHGCLRGFASDLTYQNPVALAVFRSRSFWAFRIWSSIRIRIR